MARCVVLSENFFSVPTTFRDHVLSSSSALSRHGVAKIGSGRRADALNFWSPTSFNAAAFVAVTCDRPRAASCIVLDRGHNLSGKVVTLQVSNDNFTTTTDVFSLTIPSTTQPYSRLYDAPGVRTEEGAWAYLFPAHIGLHWRLYIPAMGAGLRPKIVGLYLGSAFRLVHPLSKPFTHGLRDLRYPQVISSELWAGAGRVASRRTAMLNMRLAGPEEYQLARYHIEELMLRRKATWVFPSEDEAEKGWLGVAPPGVAGFRTEGSDWAWMRGEFSVDEHEPLPEGSL